MDAYQFRELEEELHPTAISKDEPVLSGRPCILADLGAPPKLSELITVSVSWAPAD